MKTDPNAPARPIRTFSQNQSTGEGTIYEYAETGLTIRAELAARAMEGWLASFQDSKCHFEQLAEFSVRCADALIAELNKENT